MSDIESYAVSHIGHVREENQDAVLLHSPTDEKSVMEGHLCGIADGMGGYSHGRVASVLALTTFFDTFYGEDGNSVANRLRQGIKIANLEVLQKASQMGAVRMGTTLSVVYIHGNRLSIAHVGDSRVYLVRKHKAVCLTDDHSKVGELVRMKLLPPEKLRTHYQRSVLTKSIGFDLFVQPDIETATIHTGDLIILCTDGVWGVIEEHELAELASTDSSAAALGNKIIELALERQTDDNISVIVLKVHNAIPEVGSTEETGWHLLKLLRRKKRIEDL